MYSAGTFLSTPSARRATSDICGLALNVLNFYPRPPRGGRHQPLRRCYTGQPISIHALREEGDIQPPVLLDVLFLFLSTPSARRATKLGFGDISAGVISIHALREEGDPGQTISECVTSQISIHALREEGDFDSVSSHAPSAISIHALREEGDGNNVPAMQVSKISIHALREEGDGSLSA